MELTGRHRTRPVTFRTDTAGVVRRVFPAIPPCGRARDVLEAARESWAEAPQAGSAGDREEGRVLKEGDKAPGVTGTSYDGATFDLGSPGKRTVLFFYPKATTGG